MNDSCIYFNCMCRNVFFCECHCSSTLVLQKQRNLISCYLQSFHAQILWYDSCIFSTSTVCVATVRYGISSLVNLYTLRFSLRPNFQSSFQRIFYLSGLEIHKSKSPEFYKSSPIYVPLCCLKWNLRWFLFPRMSFLQSFVTCFIQL